MQHTVILCHGLKDAPHRYSNAALLDLAHISQIDAAPPKTLAFAHVVGADAEEIHFAGIDGLMCRDAEHRLEAALARQEGKRHAMQVSRRRGSRRVEVGMRIEP